MCGADRRVGLRVVGNHFCRSIRMSRMGSLPPARHMLGPTFDVMLFRVEITSRVCSARTICDSKKY